MAPNEVIQIDLFGQIYSKLQVKSDRQVQVCLLQRFSCFKTLSMAV